MSNNIEVITNIITSTNFGKEFTMTASVLSALKSSFDGATNYRTYNGYTSAADECGWYGFKHTSSKTYNYGIGMSNSWGVFVYRRKSDNTWNFWKVIQ